MCFLLDLCCTIVGSSGPVFCLLLRVSSDCAQPIIGQVTINEVLVGS